MTIKEAELYSENCQSYGWQKHPICRTILPNSFHIHMLEQGQKKSQLKIGGKKIASTPSPLQNNWKQNTGDVGCKAEMKNIIYKIE